MSTEKFQGKYRTTSIRAPWWDYGRDGAYFITICTKNREHYFGDVTDQKMVLSSIGEIANSLWFEIPEHFSYAKLDEFVVMPNHIHGILIIDKLGGGYGGGGHGGGGYGGDAINRVSTISTTHTPGGITGDKNPMLHDNVSKIIRWYKGRCTYEIRKIHADFGWQSRFYDHIIRDDAAYQRISNYIIQNPQNWKDDKFHK